MFFSSNNISNSRLILLCNNFMFLLLLLSNINLNPSITFAELAQMMDEAL